MKQNNAQAITGLQMVIALRHIEKNDLEKIIANEYESGARKSFARSRLAEIELDEAADQAELERLKTLE